MIKKVQDPPQKCESIFQEVTVMSRTILTVRTNASRDSVLQFLSVELPRLGYTDRSTPTERIWGKNDGVMIKGQRISVHFQPGEVYLSAWLHDAITVESDLNGFVAKPLKTVLRQVLEQMAAGIAALPAASPALQNAVYCSACGKPAEPGSRFCTRCGNPL